MQRKAPNPPAYPRFAEGHRARFIVDMIICKIPKEGDANPNAQSRASAQANSYRLFECAKRSV